MTQSKSKITNRHPKIPKMEELKKMQADPTLIPLSDFFEAYFQCRKHKRSTPNARHFEINYEEKLIELWYEVNTHTYEIGTSICFLVRRPKLREVFAADFRDRIVHHIIMMRLEPLFEKMFIDDTYNCRKEKGTLYGINRLYDKVEDASEHYTKKCYIGKFDLQGFFMSIHKPTLWKLMEQFIIENYHGNDKELILYLVNKVILHHPERNCKMKTAARHWKQLPKNKSLFTCGWDRGLAIGNLTSQCFANFYMHFFDDYMIRKFKYYGRYVDDFFVIADTKEEIVNAVPEMKAFLKNMLKLKLHPDKTYIQSYDKGVKFTGSVVKKDRRYIGNQTVSGMYDKIEIFNHNICEANAESFIQTLNSYFGFFKHYETYGITYKMILKIDKEWFKYIDIVNMKKAVLRGYVKPTKVITHQLVTDKDSPAALFDVVDDEIGEVFIDPNNEVLERVKPDMAKVFGTVKEKAKLYIKKECKEKV